MHDPPFAQLEPPALQPWPCKREIKRDCSAITLSKPNYLPVVQVVPDHPGVHWQLPVSKQMPPFAHDKEPPALHPKT
jgi:hypothetical protein